MDKKRERGLMRADQYWRPETDPETGRPDFVEIKRENRFASTLRVVMGRRYPTGGLDIAADDRLRELRVDHPLAEAIEKKMIQGERDELLEGLVFVAIGAHAVAMDDYRQQLYMKSMKEHRRTQLKIVEGIKSIISEVEADLYDGQHFMGKIDECCIDELNEMKEFVRKCNDIAEAGKIFLDKLEPYLMASSSLAPNATNHEERRFFLGVAEWWSRTAANIEGRTPKAARNRIAAALWLDCDGEIPKAYNDDGDGGGSEMWAARKFRDYGC